MSNFQIAISDQLHSSGWDVFLGTPGVSCLGPFSSRIEMLGLLSNVDAIIIRSGTLVDIELLDHAPRLKVIARAGAGLENIDLDEATRRGILVIHTPYANVTAVAEYTLALMLAMARDLQTAGNALRSGTWPRHSMLGFQLFDKTLGIIGFGRLGREVASRAQAFGMHILAYDPYIDYSFANMHGVEMVNLDELLARADIITLHTAVNQHTQSLIDEKALGQIRPGAYLINCAHASLIDETALASAIKSGRLAGAALDTFAIEPIPADHPFLSLPNLILTPHLNQNTHESQAQTCRQVALDVLDALRGEDYRNVANLPFSPELPYSRVHPYLHLASRLGRLQGQLADGWITKVEVELLGEGMSELVRPVTAMLLSGMLRPVNGRQPNWISAPAWAYAQGIETIQTKHLVSLADYPNLIACRISWSGGQRTVAGTLFGNAGPRLVQYDHFQVDAYPDGYVLILENADVPGVIGSIGARLGDAKINIAQWRYGRDYPGGRAVSFINLDQKVPADLLAELEHERDIYRARLVRL